MKDEKPRKDWLGGLGRTRTVATRSGGLWVGLILSVLVLIFLLIFILQNRMPVQINFLGWTGTLPTGVALLFAAIAGVLLVAIPASVQILQLGRSRAARTARRSGRRSPAVET